MIDWLTVEIQLPHAPINDGCILNLDRDGNPVYSVDKRLKVQSSHSTTVQVRSSGHRMIDGLYSHLTIDGNIAKFFQGHNIVGTDSVVDLVSDFIQYLVAEEILHMQPVFLKPSRFKEYPIYVQNIRDGDFLVKRVDINYLYKVNGGTVAEYVDFLSDTTRTRFSRTTQPGSGSVYWNQKSTHWSMKCYDKHKEMNARKKSHQLPEDWPAIVKKKLHEFVQPYARFELVLRARKLREIAEKLGYNDAYWSAFMHPTSPEGNSLKGIGPLELFNTYMDKIEVSDMSRFTVDEAIKKLQPAVYGTFAAWRSGYNVKSQLKRRTYYRHRTAIMEALGVDIALSSGNVEKHAGTSARVFRIVPADQDKLIKQVNQILADVA